VYLGRAPCPYCWGSESAGDFFKDEEDADAVVVGGGDDDDEVEGGAWAWGNVVDVTLMDAEPMFWARELYWLMSSMAPSSRAWMSRSHWILASTLSLSTPSMAVSSSGLSPVMGMGGGGKPLNIGGIIGGINGIEGIEGIAPGKKGGMPAKGGGIPGVVVADEACEVGVALGAGAAAAAAACCCCCCCGGHPKGGGGMAWPAAGGHWKGIPPNMPGIWLNGFWLSAGGCAGCCGCGGCCGCCCWAAGVGRGMRSTSSLHVGHVCWRWNHERRQLV